VAFLCAEFGVHHSLPMYSGGLGALAGDLIKEASDQALPPVAVGLLYRQGYFRQRLDASGWQQEHWIENDPERLPMALVRGPDGGPLTITVPIRGSEVSAQTWRVAVGRVPLLLLDADRPENGLLERWITSQLYVGDPVTRLSQYALLGVGGVRALEAIGIEPTLVHLNEGHAAFAVLELAREEVARVVTIEQALAAARQRTVFTTHTPVGAGNETYSREDVVTTLGAVIAELGADPEAIVRLGRQHPPDSSEPFGVTQFSLRMSRAANAVSRRHEGVAREMWWGCGRSGRWRRCRSRMSRMGCTLRPGSGRRCIACSTAILVRIGGGGRATSRSGTRSMASRTPSCGRPDASSARS
jgi:glycogen phosphorylase